MTPDGTAPQQALRELLEGAISDVERVRDVRMWRGLNGELVWRGETPTGNEIETEHPHALLESALGQLRAALASPGPRREPPPSKPSPEAVFAAAKILYEWECSPYMGRFVFEELDETKKATRLYDAELMLKEAYAVDAVGRVPLTEPRLAELLYECPDLWTAGDTDPQDREIYALAAKWLLPRLAEVSVPVSPPTEGPPTDMTRDELLDDALGRPVTPPDAPDAPPSLTEREAVLEVIEGGFDEIARICRERWDGKEGWHTSIPARPGYDSDLILVDALLAARNFIRAVGASRDLGPEIVLQINGRTLGRATVRKIAEQLAGKQIAKVVYVPDRVLGFFLGASRPGEPR